MLVQRSGKKVLVTPITAEDLMNIHIGDILYLDGDLVTCRDIAHRRLVEEGRSLPIDVCDRAIFHAGPIVRQAEGNRYEIVSVGPTTSMRMEQFEYEFIEKQVFGLSLEKAEWHHRHKKHADNLEQSTVFFLLAVQ